MAWRAAAACNPDHHHVTTRQQLDRFFGVENARGPATDYTAAKQICGSCPVAAECLTYALGLNIGVGVWGGVNMGRTGERRAALRAAGRPCATCSTVFHHPDLHRLTCSEACWQARRAAQQRASRRRRVA